MFKVMKTVIQIPSKHLRALVLMLLVLPLVPSALMLRFMQDSLRREQRLNDEAALNVDAEQLRFSARQLKQPPGFDTFDRQAVADFLLSQFVEMFGAGARVMIFQKQSGEQAATAEPPLRGSSAEIEVGPLFPGWFVRGSHLMHLDTHLVRQEEIRQNVLIATSVLGGVIVIASLAGWLLYRQLKRDELKSDFLATVSHELKTPVSSMRLLLETMQEGRVEAKADHDEYLRLLLQENHRLEKTVQNFLTFCRLQQGGVTVLSAHAHDPRELVVTAAREMSQKFEYHGGKLEVKASDCLPSIQVDRNSMLAVLDALLDNALKYADGAPEVKITAFSNGSAVMFHVADHGIGIPAGQENKVFDRFYQVDRALSRRGSGCGLGLSIARTFVESQGGKIGVIQRKQGGGSIFWIRFPASAELRVA